MTMQASDHVWYKGRRFTLIDCEKDKSLIGSADFGLPGRFCHTACHRGYLAEYYIEDNILFGEKIVEKYETKDGDVEYSSETSPRLQLNYTGSLVIAINDDDDHFGCSDSLDYYLDYDKAFELYFVDGELTGISDLSAAIEAWRAAPKDIDSKNILERLEQKQTLAKKYLRYEYGCNYKLDGR